MNSNVRMICPECASKRLEWWQQKYGSIDLTGSFVKAGIVSNGKTEHIWLEVLSTDGDHVVGRIDSDPIYINQKYNDVITFHRSIISQHINGEVSFEQSQSEVNDAIKCTH